MVANLVHDKNESQVIKPEAHHSAVTGFRLDACGATDLSQITLAAKPVKLRT
jgi:hypothetical protein